MATKVYQVKVLVYLQWDRPEWVVAADRLTDRGANLAAMDLYESGYVHEPGSIYRVLATRIEEM